ncbi:MAG: right-handed parallel beta-helix repeat-containing protein [Chitinophagaceae bacterium]|nr:right-handed parallel beta-helix repeat-containing protein [Chitinophagaceae bacterium]
MWLLFFITVSSATTWSQVNLYVAPAGNDKNAGSLQQPLQTIHRAITIAATNKGKAVVIHLRKGTYYLDTTIIIKAEDFTASSLAIKNYKDEHVTISAGRRLQLKWSAYKGGVYKAVVPRGINFERLYINGHLQVLARYPNYDSTAPVFHGTAADAISASKTVKWKNPAGGYVHALHSYEWGGFHYLIKGKDAAGELILEGGWQNNRPGPMHKEKRFVENIFEELDAPGEWFYDKSIHTLYYYPQAGVNLSNVVCEVSNLKISFLLSGTAEKPLKNVQFNGLNFAHNERSFMDTKEPLLRSDWTIYRGGAVLLGGTENCKIADCNFIGIGGNAIMFSNYNKYDTVTGCHIADIGSSAVCFIGDPKAVRSPSFGYENYIKYDQLDKTPGSLTDNYPQYCVVTDNLLHDLGEIEKQATGVEIETASSITVSHNSIYNTPRAGLNIGDGCFGGHILEYNDVFNTVQETGDHGSFNSWGRDRYWSPDRDYMDSLAAVHPELILLDAQKQTIIRNNRFRCDHGWDIDLDDGSSNYYIYNNLCLNGGLKLREGFHRRVENNIMINNSFHPHVWFKNSDDIFKHNIVMKKYAPIEVSDWGANVDYNLFPDTSALKDAMINGTDKNSIAADPLFKNPAKGDFTVAANSPALKIGFVNFPMNQFGVQKAALKKIAMQAPIPELFILTDEKGKPAIVSFLGASIKSVEGLGDRSAYGLPDETGVIIVGLEKNSLLSKAGLQVGDVIRSSGNVPVKNVKELIDLYQSVNWTGKMDLTVMRNQKLINFSVVTK